MSIPEQRYFRDLSESEQTPYLKIKDSYLENSNKIFKRDFFFKEEYTNKNYIPVRQDFRNPSSESLDLLITRLIQTSRNTPIFPIISTIVDTAMRPSAEPVSQPTPKKSFESDGFSAVEGFPGHKNITVNGEVVFSTEEKTRYTQIDFTPGGRAGFLRSKITDSIAKGLSGLVKYLSAIDTGEVEVAPLLIGNTNLNMALICQRIGFSITDDCKTEDGEIDRNKRRYTVVGRVEEIRGKIAEFQRKGTIERVQERQARLQRRQESVMFPSLA